MCFYSLVYVFDVWFFVSQVALFKFASGGRWRARRAYFKVHSHHLDKGCFVRFFSSKHYRFSFQLDKFRLDFFSFSLLSIGIILLSFIVIHCHHHSFSVSLYSI